MRTVTLKENSGVDYSAGWHTLTINNAKYSNVDGTAVLDIWFEGYPENFNMRTWAKETNGEEWRIARLFRFANAGIGEVLEEDGTKRLALDDDANQLVGKTINILFYKEDVTMPDGNEKTFARPYTDPAPTVFTNAAESFDAAGVERLKAKAEERFHSYGKGHLNGTVATTEDKEEVIPF